MLLAISWRNVWRNRGRSLVVIGSIVVGIWVIVFLQGFMNSFVVGYIDAVIKNEISHIQIHQPDFKTDYDVQFVIPNGLDVVAKAKEDPRVRAISPRTLTNGMVASSRKASGVRIMGIDPAMEASVTRHDSLVVDGQYFDGIKRHPAVIGKKLADELGVKIRSKIVLTFQDADRNITAGAFRVAGIVETSAININEGIVFVTRDDLNDLLGLPEAVHEIAVYLETPEEENAMIDTLNGENPGLLVESWRKIAPELELFMTMTESFLWVFLGIIMFALALGIINSMLMAVLERFKELGMLMAVGMNKTRVYLMIVFETIFLSVVGGPVGIFLGYMTMEGLGRTGIDLTNYSEALKQYGYDTILYPFLDSGTYYTIAVAVIVTAFVGALYPAYKAIKLSPVEALHKI